MLRADLWPAEVVLPDGRLMQGVRVQVTAADLLIVWHDVTGVAKPAFWQPVAEYEYLPPLGAALPELRLACRLAPAADGPAGVVYAHQTRLGGCGCGGSSLQDLTEQDAVEVERAIAAVRA